MTERLNEYSCPYCDRKSGSPGGIRFHIKLTHPDKLDDFNTKFYPDMEARFRASIEE